MRRNVIDISFSVFAPRSYRLLLLVLAFPPYDFSWLVWIALVPLLMSSNGRNPIFGFLLWFLFGVAFFTGIFGWIFEVPGYRFHHHFFIGLYLGPLVGLFGLALNLIRKHLGITWAYLAAPFLWTSLEYIRANLFFLSLPWAFLAHSQYQNLALIQIASISGAYGVSFLIVMVNAATAFLAFVSRTSVRNQHFPRPVTGFGWGGGVYRRCRSSHDHYYPVLWVFDSI